MTRPNRRAVIVLSLLGSFAFHVLAEDKLPPIDYEALDFSITLSSLRAGNHDPKGNNDYYFQVKLYGLPILKEEIRKSLKDRKKIERNLGEFAAVSIPSLKFWRGEKKPGPEFSLPVLGNTIREIVGETMRTFRVAEAQVSVVGRIHMLERQKLVPFWGEDLLVGESSFILLGDSLPHVPKVDNQDLKISDAQGADVILRLSFKQLENKTNP